jgi:hypothetical protein
MFPLCAPEGKSFANPCDGGTGPFGFALGKLSRRARFAPEFRDLPGLRNGQRCSLRIAGQSGSTCVFGDPPSVTTAVNAWVGDFARIKNPFQ